MSRVIVWFSCGAASAVALKASVAYYDGNCTVEACYCDTSADEHPDNARFMADVERWCGVQITRLSHPKYKTVEEAWRGEKFIVGPYGASCTRTMKREIRESYQRDGDVHILGYTADERQRAESFSRSNPDLLADWILIRGGITKSDCYKIIQAAGIELPAMYHLGYNNNNCIGCCKGGKGYWNKIRNDFPEVFAARAKVQREMGVQFGGGGSRFYLDVLDPFEGHNVPEPDIECGIMCDNYSRLLDMASYSPEVSK
jgi:hypothetical protein